MRHVWSRARQSVSRRQAGQAIVETLLVTAGMLAVVAILAVLLVTWREHGNRVLDLVAADMP